MKNYILLYIAASLSFIECGNQKQTPQPITHPTDSISVCPDTVTLLFAGDIMQHKAQLQAAHTKDGYDYSSYFQLIREELKSADLAIANLETPVGAPPYAGYPQFSAPAELAQVSKDAGFNILLTANNHSVDRYGIGIKRTIEVLDSLQIEHLGTYLNAEEQEKHHPLFIDIKGMKLAFLNYTYGTNGIDIPTPYIVNLIDTVAIKQDLLKAKNNNPDATVVCIHWGIEYDTKPSKQQKKLAQWLIENGADHIIGAHPHVIQPIHVFKDTVHNNSHSIVYSLGNFISNMSQRDTDGGLLVKIKLFKSEHKINSLISYSLVWTGRPIITKEKNFKLYPISYELDSLNINSRNKLILFKQGANKVLEHNSTGIEKFIFK